MNCPNDCGVLTPTTELDFNLNIARDGEEKLEMTKETRVYKCDTCGFSASEQEAENIADGKQI